MIGSIGNEREDGSEERGEVGGGEWEREGGGIS